MAFPPQTTTHRLLTAALGAASALALITACTSPTSLDPVPPPPSPGPSADQTIEPPSGRWEVTGEPSTIASGLAAPWSIVPLPDGGMLVSERDSGIIRQVADDGDVREVGVVPGVVAGGESGLHGLALREDAAGPRLYVYHGSAEDNRVVRFALDEGPEGWMLGEQESLITGIPRANTHNGGRIAFGPDGLLYVATGDAQQRDVAQDPESTAGKILRVTPDGDPAPGNPFGTVVYSLGHRNVQGLAWTSDGTLWASEFGQNAWDELNRIEPGGNYGWPIVEGIAGDERFTDPVIQWTPEEASPSGIAAVGDTVFVAGLRGSRLWAVTDGEAEVVMAGQGRLRDVVAAPDGGLWVLTNNTDGRGTPRSGDDLVLGLRLQAAP